MGRGLGDRQQEIRRILQAAWDKDVGPLGLAELRTVFVLNCGGDPAKGDKLKPSVDRSLKRAIKALVDRGDVLIVGGKGGQTDPYRYTIVEAFASASGEKPENTEHAKKIVAGLIDSAHKLRMAMASRPQEAE